MPNQFLAVITVNGKDQKGVVAKISTYLAEHGINIEDIDQRVLHGLFVMTMLVDLRDMTLSLDELITQLLETGRQIGMEVRVRLHSEKVNKKFAVLVTAESHCIQQILSDHKEGLYHGDLAAILSNRDSLEPLAREAGIPFESFPSTNKEEHESWLLDRLVHHKIELLVLARYMQILTKRVVGAYESRIINIHPSLLPYFPGPNAYKQAYEEGARVCGCTAHFVTEDLDRGPIILQDVFHIDIGRDTVEEVKMRGRKLEGKVLSKSIQLYLNEELVVTDGKVVFRPGHMRFPLEDE